MLKSWMKRHFELAEDMTFRRFIEAAVEANSGGHNAVGHFKHAGVRRG